MRAVVQAPEASHHCQRASHCRLEAGPERVEQAQPEVGLRFNIGAGRSSQLQVVGPEANAQRFDQEFLRAGLDHAADHACTPTDCATSAVRSASSAFTNKAKPAPMLNVL